MSKFFLSIDSGSSACKSALVDREGNIFKIVQLDLPQILLKDFWVEHDPEEIWEIQKKTIVELLKGIKIEEIISIGIANQRETVVAWDKSTGKAIYNAISWQDRRNSEFLEKYSYKKNYIQEKTGLDLDLYFSASKIDWILKNCKYDISNLCIGTIDSWLIWKLSSENFFVTDVSNASRTLIFNIVTLSWDEDLLKLFNFPVHIFPKVLSSADFFGFWEYKGFKIPINAVLGDQQSSLLGCGAIDENDTKCTYGTGAFLLSNTGNKRINSEKMLQTIAWKIKNQKTFYALEGSCFSCGNGLDWAKRKRYFDYFHNLDPKKFEPVFFCLF